MIETISLENFRAFERADFAFAPVTIITGRNGAGKTSVWEAVSLLSLTTSWKTDRDAEVVRWQSPVARITSGEREMVVQATPYLKRIKINGIAKRVSEVIGTFPTVLFQPDDVMMLYGAPALRRQYLDRVLSQTSLAYAQASLRIVKILKQRNRLLKNIAENLAMEDELSYWDQELTSIQEIIQVEREGFFAEIAPAVARVFAEMVDDGKEIEIHYHKSPAHQKGDFFSHLQANHFKEIAAGSSLYGPHREDFSVSWGDNPAEEGMSRGQIRSLLIAFKIAELEYIKKHAEQAPVLLLDDIFSELDEVRRQRLVGVFGEYQIIMTTTELGSVKGLLGPSAKVIELE